MALLIRIAWRNIWRQKRRTVITVGAMATGVAFSLAMIALSDGMYMMAFDLMVSENMGHVQVHHPDFPKQRAVYDTLDGGEALVAELEALPGVERVAGRVFGFALLGTEDTPDRPGKSAGAQLVGVDPAREAALTKIAGKVQDGRYLADAPAHEIVLGVGLAETLRAAVGDEIVAITQAADGSMGNDLYTVVGIFKTGSVIQDRAGAFLHAADVQELLVLFGQIHEVALLAHEREDIDAMKGAVDTALADRGLLVRSWDQINPSIAQMLGFQDVGNGIILMLVFSVAALGILNTMLMSVFERTKELGVIRALGLRPLQMVSLVMWETFALAGCAAVAGLVLGLGMDAYLVLHGLDLSSFFGDYSFAGASFPPIMMGEIRIEGVLQTVFGLFFVSFFAAIWPAFRAARLAPVDAMRQE